MMMEHLKSKRNSRKVLDTSGTALAKQVACTAPQGVPIRHNPAKHTRSGRFGRSDPMLNVLRRAVVAATIAFSGEMAVADGLQDSLTAAQAGDAGTQNILGVIYANGTGVLKDVAEAVRWFRLAADQGLVYAQRNLGWMYENGNGVLKDAVEAVRWYRRAADQGDAMAQGNLGLMYIAGSRVPRDIVTAHMWLNIASANGWEPAAELRDSLEQQMTPEDISAAIRRAKLCMASSYADCD